MYRYQTLICGKLVRRINRFVCEVIIDGFADVTLCYMANPGSMLGMCIAGAPIRASRAPEGSSKFEYRVEGIKIGNVWIGCNTLLANKIISSLLMNNSLVQRSLIPKYDSFRHEVREGTTRFDFVTLADNPKSTTIIEVKTVTMASNWYDIEIDNTRADRPIPRFPSSRPPECCIRDNRILALFPDCQSKRAQKHVAHLASCSKRQSTISVMVFVVVRDDVDAVAPSEYCDPAYAALVRKFCGKEVSCLALKFRMHLEDPLNSFVEFIGDIPVYVSEEPDPPEGPMTGYESKRVRYR